MDDARRFFRYLIPGALFALETVVILLFFLPHETIEKLGEVSDRGFGAAVAAIFGSGSFGFLLSAIHHWFYWHWPRWGRIDHRAFLRRLQDDQVLTINGEQPNAAVDAWTIVTGLWHERARSNPIQAANARSDSLANLVHSCGAAKVGYYSGLATATLILFYVSWPETVPFTMYKRWVLAVIGAVVVVFLGWIHHAAYRDTLRISQHVVEQILEDALHTEGTEGCVQTHFRN